MGSERGIHVALVGLGFGAEFVPIYRDHPNVAELTLVDPDPAVLSAVGDRFGIAAERQLPSLDAALATAGIDAVHLVTPIPLHARQSIAVLEAGKHCACTVPMATSLDDLRAVVAAQQSSGRHYTMMETAVYSRRFFYARDLVARGEVGRIQFLRGAHYQDMEDWPFYWQGLPPMHYATHAVAPLLALADTRATAVHCFGSGAMREELRERYGNPYPVETAIFELEAEPSLAAEVTRTLFQTARDYAESFSVYGEHSSFEWEQVEGEAPIVFRVNGAAGPRGRGRSSAWERVEVPDRADLLPPAIARYTRRGVYGADASHRSFEHGGGHGGSHPHLVHAFVRAIVEDRPPWPDAATSADWTAPGICAHASAMRGGARVEVPCFRCS